MRKSIVFGLVGLALVVFITPGIIGGIAEKRVKENIDWAAGSAGEGELDVVPQSFERTWFSSDGEYRIAIGDGQLRGLLLEETGITADQFPELVVTTRLDHGLIPLSSLSRENGSLAPALGSAVSTVRIETADGDVFELPGKIYSKIGLGGGVDSTYVLEPGSRSFDEEGEASWESTNIRVSSNPSSGRLAVDGKSRGFSATSPGGRVRVGEITLSSDMLPSKFGVSVGDFALDMATIDVEQESLPATSIGPLSVRSNSSVSGERISADTQLSAAFEALPGVGDASMSMDVSISGLDGESAQKISSTMNEVSDDIEPAALYALVEQDLETLVRAGFEIDMRKLDVDLPQGLIQTAIRISLPEAAAGPFSWGSALRSMSGKATLALPGALVDTAITANPQVQMAVGMGFLQKNGESYNMEALFEKGLLTVNGSPIPVPLPP